MIKGPKEKHKFLLNSFLLSILDHADTKTKKSYLSLIRLTV